MLSEVSQLGSAVGCSGTPNQGRQCARSTQLGGGQKFTSIDL